MEYLTEQEQWERVLAWLRAQGPWILAGIVVALLGYGGARYWRARQQNYALAAEAGYEQVLEAVSANDLSGGLKLADQLIKRFPGSAYADQARLEAASIEVQQNHLAPAAVQLSAVMRSTNDPQLALVARLRLARVQISMKQPDAALKTLDGARRVGAFAARYAEVRGDALLAKGDRAGALREYRAARAAGSDTVDTDLLDLKIDALAHS